MPAVPGGCAAGNRGADFGKYLAGKPNEKWTTDITYIWVESQWL